MSDSTSAKSAGAIAIAAVLAGCLATVPMAIIGLTAVIFMISGGGSSQSNCHATGQDAPVLNDDQRAVADAVMATVTARGLDAADAVIAMDVAYTESTLRNLDYGDTVGPDSRGIMQQRESWGPLEVRMDPAGATGLFLNALTDPTLHIFGTQDLVNATPTSRHEIAPWITAQSVQRSGFYDGSNYRANYLTAAAIVATYLTPEEMSTAQIEYWAANGIPTTPGVAVITCDGGKDVGTAPDDHTGAGPGAWGGHSNGHIPVEAMCPISFAPAQKLRCDAAEAIAALNDAYRGRFGRDISITDSYRSYEQQVAIKGSKGWLAARPGTSNHGWGLALDLGDGMTSYSSPQYQWMRENAPAYGWDNPTWARPGGNKNEPWHWEYNGL